MARTGSRAQHPAHQSIRSARRRKRRVRITPGSSGDFLPPSPPAEKTTGRKDQAGQSSTGDGAWDGRPISHCGA
jgi:hypothetical protein